MFKSIFLPIIAVAAFVTLVGLLSQGRLNPLLNKISVATPSTQKIIRIDSTEINVEVAKTNEERAKGLSNRISLGDKAGMIFIFNKGSMPVFWMKDTKIPLDFIWILNNKIVKIDKDVQPELDKNDSELKKYKAPSAIDFVLEVNGGFSDKYSIKVGQMISGLEQL